MYLVNDRVRTVERNEQRGRVLGRHREAMDERQDDGEAGRSLGPPIQYPQAGLNCNEMADFELNAFD